MAPPGGLARTSPGWTGHTLHTWHLWRWVCAVCTPGAAQGGGVPCPGHAAPLPIQRRGEPAPPALCWLADAPRARALGKGLTGHRARPVIALIAAAIGRKQPPQSTALRVREVGQETQQPPALGPSGSAAAAGPCLPAPRPLAWGQREPAGGGRGRAPAPTGFLMGFDRAVAGPRPRLAPQCGAGGWESMGRAFGVPGGRPAPGADPSEG